MASAGIPALGFFAQVPHYVSGAYPNGAIELIGHVGRFLGQELPLAQAAQAHRQVMAAGAYGKIVLVP